MQKRARPAAKPSGAHKKKRSLLTDITSQSIHWIATSSKTSSKASSSSTTRSTTRSTEWKTRSKSCVLPTIGLVSECHAAQLGKASLVVTASETDLIHYTCFGERDVGWGCAYRCLQMILSNAFLLSGADDAVGQRWQHVPSLRQLQVRLVQLKRLRKRDIGGTTWIEPPDVGCYLRSYGLAADDAVFRPRDHTADFKAQLLRHFERERTPVMIDDRVKAYCLLGARIDPGSDAVTHLLRFDPHATQYRRPDRVSAAKWMPFSAVFYSPEWLVLFPKRPSPDQLALLIEHHTNLPAD